MSVLKGGDTLGDPEEWADLPLPMNGTVVQLVEPLPQSPSNPRSITISGADCVKFLHSPWDHMDSCQVSSHINCIHWFSCCIWDHSVGKLATVLCCNMTEHFIFLPEFGMTRTQVGADIVGRNACSCVVLFYVLCSFLYVLCFMFNGVCSVFFDLCSVLYVLYSVFNIPLSMFYIQCSLFFADTIVALKGF